MVQKKDMALLANAFAKVANNNKYWNQWIVADAWATIINQELKLTDEMKVTGGHLTSSLLRSVKYKSLIDVVDIYNHPNAFGLFRSKIAKVTAFYVTATTSCPKLNNHMPGGSTQFVRDIVVATIQTRATTTTTNTTTNLPSTTASTPLPPPVEADDAEQQECRPRKKSRRWMSLPTEQEPQQQARFNDGQFGSTTNLRKRKTTTTTDSDTNTTTAESDAAPSPPANVAANEILNQDFFDSPEANILFGMICNTTTEEDVSVRTTIERRINKLTEAFSTPDGWKCVLEDRDASQTCTPFQIYNIQMKCRYIAIALRVALRKMGQGAGGVTWLECCQQAMHTVNEFNNTTYIKFHRTIQQWHLIYRRNYECFPNPNTHKKDGKATLPRLLEENPDLKDAIVYFARDHLHELSASLLFHFLHEEALPALVEKKREELDNQQYSKDDLLVDHQLGKLTLRTVYKWMERLGFRYQPRMKCYYVDGHEKPEVIVYRRNFMRRYIEQEQRMFRWIQLPLLEVEAMVEAGELQKGMGRQYKGTTTGQRLTTDNTNDWVEFHIDDHPSFQKRMNETTEFGGNLSVFMPPNPKALIGFGQDESILKQYAFTPKAWCAPDGTRGLIPKDEGAGVMISAFVSREYGFGMDLSPDDLARVNQTRNGKKYSDEVAAIAVNGNANKQQLTKNPFVTEFEYGVSGQGYWDYNHMVLQMEDCIDVLDVVHGTNTYEYQFLFDHSSGHDKKRPDGLSVTRMTKYFGGGAGKDERLNFEFGAAIRNLPSIGRVGTTLPWQHPIDAIPTSRQRTLFPF